MTTLDATPATAGPAGREPHLIGTDLDGTIVGQDGTVSRRTVAALRARIAAGDRVIFLTGRSPWDSRERLPLDVLTENVMVCANGAVDLETEGDVLLRAETIRDEDMRLLATTCRRLFPGGWFCLDGVGGTAIELEHPWRSAMAPSARPVADAASPEILADIEPFKVTYLHPRAGIEEMVAAVGPVLGDRVTLTYGSRRAPCFLEFAALGASKGAALARHARALGIPPERVLAFGDMPNDVSMFAAAGHSFAMADAPVPVRRAAGAVIGGVADDAVAEVLENLDSAIAGLRTA
ncbi:MAG: HAD-IIB family hydrolase [Brachybacterium tyrofermentans]|uniref:HAD-IIB family hydrolase n=1 Tax=Brachybacterium tyrofermentans TaxID=47848 RepID=UPI0018684B8E|nr:HAD-IIB family hydrolase [Brachybacterium tyrofermentans]